MIRQAFQRGRIATGVAIAVPLLAFAIAFAPTVARAKGPPLVPVTATGIPTRAPEQAGLHSGSFFYYPSLTLFGAYDDNVLASESNEQDDVEGTISPEMVISGDTGRWIFTGLLGATLSNHAEQSGEDVANVMVRGALLNRPGAMNRLRVVAGFVRRAEETTSPDRSLVGDRNHFNRALSEVTYFHQPDRWGIGGFAGVERRSMSESFDADRDRTFFTLEPGIAYQVRPGLDVTAGPFYIRTTYDDETDRNGLARDNERLGARAEIKYEINDRLRLTAELAPGTIAFTDPSFDDEFFLAVDARLEWRPEDQTAISFSISRSPEPTTQNNVPYTEDTRFRGTVTHVLPSSLQLNLDAALTTRVFDAISRTDIDYDLDLSAEYPVAPQLRLFSRYGFRARESDVSAREFLRNQIVLGIRAQI